VARPCDDLEVSSDPLSPLAGACPLDFSIIDNNPNDILIVHDSSLPLAPLEELEEGDRAETNASSNLQCAYQLSQRIPFLRSTLLMSILMWILVRLNLIRSLVILFMLSLSMP